MTNVGFDGNKQIAENAYRKTYLCTSQETASPTQAEPKRQSKLVYLYPRAPITKNYKLHSLK